MLCVLVKGVARKTSSALMYFSTHCCAWKHTVSVGQSAPSVSVCEAFNRSFSALASHSRSTTMTGLGADIQHLAFMGRRPFNRTDHVLAPRKCRRRADDYIDGNRNVVQGLVYLQPLVE